MAFAGMTGKFITRFRLFDTLGTFPAPTPHFPLTPKGGIMPAKIET